MSTLEIILSVAVVAFITLVVFLIILICISYGTLQRVNHTVESLQKQLDDLGHEPKNLMHNVNAISANVHGKMRNLDPFFRAAAHIGEEFEYQTKNKSFFRASKSEAEENNTAYEVVEWALLGIDLWQKFKTRR